MSSRTKKQSRKKGEGSKGFLGNLFSSATRLPAHVTEEQDWYMDVPNVRLTRVFAIVLVLHVVAVGGILAFKMLDKAPPAEAVLEDAGKPVPTTEVAGAADPAPAPAAATTTVTPEAAVRPEPRANPVIVDDPAHASREQYRVSSGESLVSIARDLNVSVAELRQMNNLDTGDQLYPGRWLSIPRRKQNVVEAKNADDLLANNSSALKATPALTAKPVTDAPQPSPEADAPKPAVVPVKPVPVADAPKPNPAPTPAPAMVSSASGNTYVVQAGDTPYGVSRRFNVSLDELMKVNDIADPTQMKAGQTLRIPGH